MAESAPQLRKRAESRQAKAALGPVVVAPFNYQIGTVRGATCRKYGSNRDLRAFEARLNALQSSATRPPFGHFLAVRRTAQDTRAGQQVLSNAGTPQLQIEVSDHDPAGRARVFPNADECQMPVAVPSQADDDIAIFRHAAIRGAGSSRLR